MDTFGWNPLFETGIQLVDRQHRRLVTIINALGQALIAGTTETAAIAKTYHELTDYAQQHFADEERLMTAAAVAPDYQAHHSAMHRQFVGQLEAIWSQRAPTRESAEAIHGFLSNWLTFHILDEDQVMAGAIRHAPGNSSAATNPGAGESPEGKGNAVLLASLRELHRALADSNTRLEDQVRSRTRELLQAEKMAAIGQLAAGLAHEINNPLGFVISNIGTLSRYARQLLEIIDACAEYSSSDPVLAARFESISADTDFAALRSDLHELLDETHGGLDRVKKIIRALQEFAFADSDGVHDTNILEGLETTLNIVAGVFRGRIALVRDWVALPRVPCVPGEINQVFMNLLVNAAEAMSLGGTITLSSGFDDDGIWIDIADTGVGIADQHLPHVFEPFFTTKPVGAGIGLGLSTSWDIIVDRHAGRIEARQNAGRGSTFRVWLPRRPATSKRRSDADSRRFSG